MLQKMTQAEIEAIDRPTLTRAQKLARWAELLRAYTATSPYQRGVDLLAASIGIIRYVNKGIIMGDRMEHRADADQLSWAHSPMAVAFADQVLKDAGLKDATWGEAKRFFELTAEQMHELSCNCGGVISGSDMADRLAQF